jgi:hypothetical protein
MLLQASNDADNASIPFEFGASKFSFNVGNVLINTTADNGVDKLQVNGSGTFSSSVSGKEFIAPSNSSPFTLNTNAFSIQQGFNASFISAYRTGGIKTELYVNSTRVEFSDAVKISNLAGTGIRTIVADASGNLSATALIRLTSYTVSTLPAGTQGDTACVTDATAPTYLGALIGGGTIKCPVFFNGTIWISH